MEVDSLIEARNVQVNVGSKHLLAGVTLEIRPGETVAVVGPNGAGKSTLRKALCGDVETSGGEVLMNGRPLSEWSLIERAKRRAVMPQDSTLNFPFTVIEVVLMGRAPHLKGAEGAHDYEVARRALESVEARHLEERLYPTLSGGERQRVHLARALAQIWEGSNEEPRYLLLDEPTSNLDLSHQHSALSVARRIASDRVGVLVILHDLNLAAQYADRVVMLKDGIVTASGTAAEVFTPRTIQETFAIPVIVTQHPRLPCPLVVPDVAP
ncbi:MAG TPA: heme ABC transporter ATP-binding protein [Pyrinomonadaceae bacterium]|nr:heme ABC transporter ATP-binding protein [Pyrinomonadaceae bacterium]